MKIIRKISLIIIISVMLSGCYERFPQEELAMIIGLGYDIENQDSNYKYKDTSETFIVKGEKKIEHEVLSGESKTIYSTENELQMKLGRKWVIGTELVYLIGEERARYGIKDLIDSQIRDHERRVVAGIAITKQPAESIYRLQPRALPTIAEDIRGILDFAKLDNFFSVNNNVSHFLELYYQEGRKIVIPYIEKIDNDVKITGLALFKEDKMLKEVKLDEARLINLLRNSDSNGYIGINLPEKNEYYEGYFKNKIKVKVSKVDKRLKYDIFVNLVGPLKVNTVDKKLIAKKEVEHIQEVFSEKIQMDLMTEVEKMQKEYGTDWLDLGKYAAAKYGRQSDYASDKVFRDAIIDVHVDVKISDIGQKKK